jgi:hypothetical protein
MEPTARANNGVNMWRGAKGFETDLVGVTPWIEPPSGSAVDRLDRRGDTSLGMGGKRIS